MYLAFQNVHGASTLPNLTLQAPLASVNLYNTTALDTYKVMGGMTTELDLGVSMVVKALATAGLLPNAVVTFCSDNGGRWSRLHRLSLGFS
jgi:hypothetical protein